jgi:hypothetical protein
MKGTIIKNNNSISIKTEKGNFEIHEDSRNRNLKKYKNGDEVNVVLIKEDVSDLKCLSRFKPDDFNDTLKAKIV